MLIKEKGDFMKEESFLGYTYKEIYKVLRDYLGREDNYFIPIMFVDRFRTLMIRHEGQWIRIEYEQLKMLL